jgi:hypothetical protein
MQGVDMYTVTITLVDGNKFTWRGIARSQYRAEIAAVKVMRIMSDEKIQSIDTLEQS